MRVLRLIGEFVLVAGASVLITAVVIGVVAATGLLTGENVSTLLAMPVGWIVIYYGTKSYRTGKTPWHIQ